MGYWTLNVFTSPYLCSDHPRSLGYIPPIYFYISNCRVVRGAFPAASVGKGYIIGYTIHRYCILKFICAPGKTRTLDLRFGIWIIL